MAIAGRRLFQFLLETKEPPYNLVAELDKIAEEKYGKKDYKVSLNKLVGWAKMPGNPGSLVVKKWAYAAALDMCLKRGYSPTSGDELLTVVRTWFDHHDYSTLDEAKADFYAHVKLPAHLEAVAHELIEAQFQKQI
jgi:hypothetical protein